MSSTKHTCTQTTQYSIKSEIQCEPSKTYEVLLEHKVKK